MGGGFNAGDVDFLEFLNVAKNAAELRADFLFFFRGEREAGKMGHVFDVDVSHEGLRMEGYASSNFFLKRSSSSVSAAGASWP